MKILLIAPLSIGVVHGGVRMQAMKTAKELEKLGVSIDYFNPWEKTDPSDYDIAHIFLAGNETLTISQRLRHSTCRVAVSPVFFTRRSAGVIRQSMKLESVAEKIVRGLFSDYSIKAKVCKAADIVLPNTDSEAKLIRDGFGISKSQISVVPNGVDVRFAEATPELFESTYDFRNFTLFVGDCSARRKNVLPLLEQHTEDDQPLVLIGNFDESDYSESCLDIIESRDNVMHLGHVDHNDPILASAYAAADVFTLPSQFETPGIAALEAALAGCEIAITKVGGTREVFGNEAEYIDPENDSTIMQAIRQAHKRAKTDILRKRILEKYTWAKVAQETLHSYQRLLNS